MRGSEFMTDDDCGAVFDDTSKYRYSLWRRWKNPSCKSNCSDMLNWLMLNPSTADSTKNDPTITRCVGFAKDWGYSGVVITNLFAYRATIPGMMKAMDDPIGVDNDRAIMYFASRCEKVICAWGNHGTHLNRSVNVSVPLRICARVYHMGLNQSGEPKHPLYLKSETLPVLWD